MFRCDGGRCIDLKRARATGSFRTPRPASANSSARCAARATARNGARSDLIIAATDQHYGPTIVSRDTAEYLKARVAVSNPWTEPMSPETESPKR